MRLAHGGARWLAVVGSVLAVACFADWYYDRFTETPFWLRVLATLGQIGLAGWLAFVFVVRPWLRTPPIDDLATVAEKAIPAFDHRLVTAIQLNRPGAKTFGMSQTLIAEVTREAGELASRHTLTKLLDARPVWRGLAVLAPVLLGWLVFAGVKPDLALTLLKRQALMNEEIPRSVFLENITQEVWPSGAEVVIRYKVTGEFTETMTGTVRVRPEGQPEDTYPLAFEKLVGDGAYFSTKLPPSATPFTFTARLADGRTRTPGSVVFEPPPQATDVEAWQLLPRYLGLKPDGTPFERYQPRGEVVNALPYSGIRVEANFNKPVVRAVLVPIERGAGNAEVDGKPVPAAAIEADRLSAGWTFNATPRLIGYRIDLTDDRGFTSPSPARRGVRMMPDQPPFVEFLKESTRNPDPTARDGKGNPRDYEWDSMPLSPGGRAMVTYHTRSETGVSRVNIAYRVIAKGEQPENLHPRDDPNGRVFSRLNLKPVAADPTKLGKFVPDLGLFEKSPKYGQVEFFPMPAANPANDPGELDAGGRVNFETRGLVKKKPDGTDAELEVGDTVELYVEVFDKVTTPDGKPILGRPAGYTREARRKTIVTEDEARALIRQRDEAQKRLQDKLRDLADDQRSIYQPPKKK